MKLALTFLFTTRGIPQLYYGEELAMEGGLHPDNRRDMPWTLVDDTDARSTEASQARDLRAFTQRLIQLRRASTALRFGLLTTLYLTPTLYSFARAALDDVEIVALNNAWETAEVTIPIHANPRLPMLARQSLPNGLSLVNALCPKGAVQIMDGSLHICLPAKTGAVYRRELVGGTNTRVGQSALVKRDL
jgi:alpha-amylase